MELHVVNDIDAHLKGCRVALAVTSTARDVDMIRSDLGLGSLMTLDATNEDLLMTF